MRRYVTGSGRASILCELGVEGKVIFVLKVKGRLIYFISKYLLRYQATHIKELSISCVIILSSISLL